MLSFLSGLLSLGVKGMLSTESAILLHFEAVGIVLFVLHGVVVSLLAFGASQCDFYAHERHLLKKLSPCITPAIVNLAAAQTTMAAIRS